jgi:hypothetical protein
MAGLRKPHFKFAVLTVSHDAASGVVDSDSELGLLVQHRDNAAVDAKGRSRYASGLVPLGSAHRAPPAAVRVREARLEWARVHAWVGGQYTPSGRWALAFESSDGAP